MRSSLSFGDRNVIKFYVLKLILPWRNISIGPRSTHYREFMITFRHTTFGRTPLDESSARRTDIYLTTHNTHNTQASPAGLELTIPASERPQTLSLDRAATAIGELTSLRSKFKIPIPRKTKVHINNILIPCSSTQISKSLCPFENYLTDMDYSDTNFPVKHSSNILSTSPRLQFSSTIQAVNLDGWFEWTAHSSHLRLWRPSTSSLDIIHTRTQYY
jgi:hypothetical protein